MNVLWLRGGGTLLQEAPQRSYFILKYFPKGNFIKVHHLGCDYFYKGFYKKGRRYWLRRDILVSEPLQLNFFPLNRFLYHLNDFFPSLLGLTSGLAGSDDIDIMVGEGFWGGLAGSILKGLLRKPFVYDYIDPYTELAGKGPLGTFMLIERDLPKLADYTICTSYHLQERAQSYGAKRTEVIPNGFNPAWLYLPVKPHEISEKRKIVLFVGQISMSKILLEASPFLSPEVLLVIAGSGVGERQIRTFVKTSGLEKRVLLLGHVPHNKIPHLIISSDVCVDPSGVETSLKMVEYGVFGKPVVALEGPVTRRFVKDQEVAISRRNPKDVANTIMHLIQYREEAEHMGKRLREKVIREYRWDLLAKRYAECLEKVVKK